mmetsp:Transcript_9875/g.16963  ORF Transcript_9875/g.16963 Transcript_9875/m.16963 type:complete len:148 (-) Transcript_9875:302-745(-)|eukprot:CAMPEP_0198209750 /NCGR_PEP_ID=MMETSP1445-20131203/17709_1 /TAXON_ID=36898 /ORGANISM="Pyramimonas sp., Strain CCMP2087" /LENGTH=147 /DNA_ID=CAMNT_0043883623 /DNA_START=153 /DNA_END=596 /DNA_ORIENTATION=+
MGKQDEKTGAGILFSCENEVLLLLRNSKHNDNTWGLPGGNVEEGDASLFETAKRESTEELGPLPENFVPLWEVPTTRGKYGQKKYAVFVCALAPDVKKSWVPTLNDEHREWRWFKKEEVINGHALHPVVDLLVQQKGHLAAPAGVSS